MQGLKVKKGVAQEVHELLKGKGLLDLRFKPLQGKDSLVFPLKERLQARELKKLGLKGKLLEKKFRKRKERASSLKETVKGFLSKKELDSLVTSFDSYGNIAVIEIPEALKGKEKLIGESLLKADKKFKTVAKITGKHDTAYRVRPVKVIAGEKNLLADYRENGCRFRFEVGKVFFSPRLSTERQRISGLIKKEETVGAFFAGVGPFPIVFARNSRMKKAVAIELSPVAFRFLKENIALNRAEEKIKAIKGDVKRVAKRFTESFDRIVMPLPKGGESFLSEAIHSIRKGGIVHFYSFVSRDAPFREAVESIKREAQKQGRKARIVRKAKVRSFSPSVIQIVIDFKIL